MPKKIPEFVMIKNRGKRELHEVIHFNRKTRKLIEEITPEEICHYIDQQHKKGKLQEFVVKQTPDKTFVAHLDHIKPSSAR